MLWAARDGARTTLGGSVGWCGAINDDPAHHQHGAWPLVEPMSSSELMADLDGELAIAGRVRALARLAVAIPLQGDPDRVVAAMGS